MPTLRKIVVRIGVMAVGVLLLLGVFTVISSRYYEDRGARCLCGYEGLIQIKDDGYYRISPGHGVPASLAYKLRPDKDGWEMLSVRLPGEGTLWMSPASTPEGTVVGRMRFQGGDLWTADIGSTNWTRHARVYNLWRIWGPEWNARPRSHPTCVNNLKQIGLAFRQWALDNADQFSFNVSTNMGGAMEFCSVDKEGFVVNPVMAFVVMSNELNTPFILHCPQDRKRKAVRTFAEFSRDNLTYRLRTGTNLSDGTPREVLIVCPIDGNTAYCDGSVVEAVE